MSKGLFSKITGVILAAGLALSLAACGSGNADAPAEPAETAAETSGAAAETPAADDSDASVDAETPAAEDAAESGSDILVIYFSRTGEQYGVGVIEEGNTAVIAQMIADRTGADTYEVLPADPERYPMTYDELTAAALEEQNAGARPEIAGELPDLSGYDTVFIGAPVWWGDWPMIMYTLFENTDLAGKTLYPFATHAGSGLSNFDGRLAEACPDSTVGTGFAITGEQAQNDRDAARTAVEEWLEGLGY